MNSIAGIPIDVVKNFTPKLSNKTTDHPVEKSADITDHIQEMPFEFSMECVVSNNPIGAIAKDPTRQGKNPARDVYDQLVAVHAAKKTITVVTPRGTFADMVLLELSAPIDAAAGDSLLFTVNFKHITIIENKRTTVIVRTSVRNGTKKKSLGDRQAELGDQAVALSYVIRVATNQKERAQNTKLYGVPLTCIDVSELNFDHYEVDPKKIKPDGFMSSDGHYHSIQGFRPSKEGVDETVAKYNPATDDWRFSDGSKANEKTWYNPDGKSWDRINGKDGD